MSRAKTHRFAFEKNGARITVEYSGLDRLTVAEQTLVRDTLLQNVFTGPVATPGTVLPVMSTEDLLRREA